MRNLDILSTHERILQKTLQNCSNRNIHARITSFQKTLQQLNERFECKKICVDSYSMLKYIILSLIEKKRFPSVDFLLQNHNQEVLKPIIDEVNCMVDGIHSMFGDSDDIVFIFPQEDHFRVDRYYEGPLRTLMNKLLASSFKQERKKQEYNFEREENSIYELAKILFHNSGAYITNPFTFEEQISFLGQQKSEGLFKLPKVVNKIKVPWLNNSLFYEDPCAAQLSYLASQGYICFSWSSTCLNYIPIGFYIIGFEIENLGAFTMQQTKVSKLESMGKKLENQDQLLCDLHSKITESENVLYIFDSFIEKIEKQGFAGTQFRTDQLFLTALLPFSDELDLSERNLIEIRNGRYSMAEWMINKVFIRYLMIELHPVIIQVSALNYKHGCSKTYHNQFKVLFEQDISCFSLEQQHQVIKNYSQKYLFIHKCFQRYINQYVPNELQFIHSFFKQRSPVKNFQEKSTKKTKKSTNQTEGKKEVEQPRIRRVSRNLFPQNQESDSDIDSQ